MKRKNVTRSALFTSIISLLLCVSMLVGTTFAWFTDSVESGRNIIAAGNLDVELYHSDKNATDVPVDGSTKLFDDVTPNLWEPGAVAYENLQVKNVGTLALKYQLNLTVLDETVVNGYKLSDVIMVGLIPGGVTGTDRDAVIAQVGTWTKLSDFKLDSSTKTLAAGAAAEKFGIVLYWQPNANEIDNRYNMNNTNKGQTLKLDIGVNLYATQVEAESDSFDNTYDEDAWSDAFQVQSAEDLQTAINAGETEIMLMADISVSEAIEIPAGKTVALNLNGKTISAATGNAIKNNGTLTISGGTVKSDSTYAVNNNGTLNVDAATLSGVFNSGSATLNNTTVNNVISGRHAVYHSGSALTVNGGNFSSTSGNELINASAAAAPAVINDGTFTMLGKSYLLNNVIINGGTFNGYVNADGTNDKMRTNVTVNGGTFNFDPTAYVADDCLVIANNDGTWSVYAPGSTMTMEDGAVLDLGGAEFTGKIVAEGDLTIKGDTKINKLSATNGGTITIEDGKTLTMAQFSFGSKNNPNAEYTITGGTVVSTTGFFQHGKYNLYSNLETDYMYYSYNCDVTVYGTVHSKGLGDGLDYVRGKVTIANGGKSIHDQALWVGQPASWGAMSATMIVEEGGYVQANALSVYDGSAMYNSAANIGKEGVGVKYNTINGEVRTMAASSDELKDSLASGTDEVVLSGDVTIDTLNVTGAASALTIDLAPDTTVTVASGAAAGKNVTFTGEGTVKLVNTNPGYEGKLSYQDNANLTFEGITFDASEISGICARGGVVTFVDCTINGELKQTIASKFVFNGCTFDVGVTQAGYGCSDVVFENCKFETDGYGIKIYSEGHTPVNLTVKNCSFKSTNTDTKSAIFLDHIVDGISYNITVEGCTFEGYTATPTASYNKWAERMIVTDSFVKTADGQYIFSYQTGAEGGNYHKILAAEQLVVTVK